MARSRTTEETTEAPKPKAAERPYEGAKAEGWESTDLGDAAATGEHAYAGERSKEAADDRPDEERAGTAAHLGDSPYAGSLGDG
jgi:hypothetical protein